MRYLYIFDINLLPVVLSFLNSFSSSVSCLHFNNLSFAVPKLLRKLGLIFFFIFIFIPFAFGDRKKGIYVTVSYLPFLLKVSWVYSFKFRSLIHFELIFVYGMKECSNFIDLQWDYSAFPAPLGEETVFFSWCDHQDAKETACKTGNPALVPGLGRSPGKRNGYPLQYSCLGNPMDRGS